MPIPTSGTFRVLVNQVASISFGAEFQSGSAAGNCAADILPAMSNAAIAAYLNSNTGANPAIQSRRSNAVYCGPPTEDPGICFGLYPPAGLYQVVFWPATDEIIFNPGGSQIVVDSLTSDFPSGFLCTALQLVWIGNARDFSGGGQDIVNFRLRYNSLIIHEVAAPTTTGISSVTTGDTLIIPANVYRGVASALHQMAFEATHEENSVVNTACGDFDSSQSSFAINKFYLQGEYILWSAVSLIPDTVDKRNLTDTVFTLTDTDSKLLQLTNLYVDGTEITNIITHTAGIITFTLPSGIPITPGISLTITGLSDGTEFTGTTEVGSISVIRVDGSGIYKLVPGQTYDKLYNRDDDPIVIDDVKIPDPFGRTGFF